MPAVGTWPLALGPWAASSQPRASVPDANLFLGTKLTNKTPRSPHFLACYSFSALVFCSHQRVAAQKNNFRRLLRTVEALSDLGPEMTAEREFSQTARAMLSALLQAAGAREGVLFSFSDKPSLLSSIAADGFTLMPEPAVIPLLPKHVHALTITRTPL